MTPEGPPNSSPGASPGQSLGECEAMQVVVASTADGAASIAGATVESGSCQVQWCSVAPSPDGGAVPCAQVIVHPMSSCELSFVSIGGERRRASISVTTAAPPLRCRVRDMVYEIPQTSVNQASITLDFATPAADAGRD